MPSLHNPDPQPPAAVATLADIVERVGGRLHAALPDAPIAIADVTHDSRSAGPGVLFAARPGVKADGHDFAGSAVAAGSPAVLVERVLDLGVPQVVVGSVADALGPAAAAVHGDPSQEMALVGVTGTNGKTTTAFLLEAGLAAAGYLTGLIGTVSTRIAGEDVAGVRTTPEGSDLQRLFRRMRQRGVTAGAMEVSSHGLALGRVNGTRFAAVGFTNLSHDHLDFHGHLEEYFRAKASLFTDRYAPIGVVNLDDAAGRRLTEMATLPIVGVSTEGAVGARVTATDVELRPGGSRFVAVVDGRRVELQLRVPGPFNVSNALMALALLHSAGIDLDMAAHGIGALRAVPGRMEPIDAGQPFDVIVDYAHTPDALERVLAAARTITSGRVIVVVGCGGDRDQAKRPVMGRVAAAGADLAVLTSDNPRSEDPEAILDAVFAGTEMLTGARVMREPDRREAIGHALGEAAPGDVVVIAGKGHEQTQELADRTIAFDDRAVARAILAGVDAGVDASEGQA